MAQDKAMASLCLVILQLEEHPSGSKSRKGRGEAAPICPPLHLRPRASEGNSPDPSETAWLGPRVGGNS